MLRTDMDDHAGDFFDRCCTLDIGLGRLALTNPVAISSIVCPTFSAASRKASANPSDEVGLGRAALTVTPICIKEAL